MPGRAAFPLLPLACAAMIGGCGGPAVIAGHGERAGDAVTAFMRTCRQGEWPAAVDILSDDARSFFITAGDPSDACVSELGLDPTKVRAAVGATGHTTGADLVLRTAIGEGRVRSVKLEGDQAEVAVEVAGLPGTADLEGGERYRISTK